MFRSSQRHRQSLHSQLHGLDAQEAPYPITPVEKQQFCPHVVARISALERDQQKGFAQQHETQAALHALTGRVDYMEKQLQGLPQAKLRKLPDKIGVMESQIASFSPSKLKDLIAGQQCCEAAIKHVEEEVAALRHSSAPAEVESIVELHSKLLDAHRETAASHRDQLHAISSTMATLKQELSEASHSNAELSTPRAEVPAQSFAELMEEVKQIRHGLDVVQLQAQSTDARTRVAIAMASRQQTMSPPPGQHGIGTIPWGHNPMHPPVQFDAGQPPGVISC